MVSHSTVSTGATGARTLDVAGGLTLVFEAGLIVPAVTRLHALPLDAPVQGVTQVPSPAGAHRPVVPLPVVAGGAIGIGTAGVGSA